jgi:hypothetical protein
MKPPKAGFQKGNKLGFRPGQSGNPGGRHASLKPVVEAARELSTFAIEVLREIAADKDAPPVARVHAANSLLDRGHGRPSISAALAIADLGPSDYASTGRSGVATLLGRVQLFKSLGDSPPAADDAAALSKTADSVLAALDTGMTKEQVADALGRWLTRQPALPVPVEPAADGRASKPLEPATHSPTAAEASTAAPTGAAPEEPPAEPTPKPKPRPKGSGLPGGFAEFSARKAAERAEAERIKALYPNGAPREVVFPANSGPGYEGPEVVTVTRKPGTNSYRRI